jgi:hypothetical protein
VNGRAGYRFEATVEDKGTSGSNDRFRIKITGPEGSNFSYDSHDRGNDKIDGGGNIAVIGGKKTSSAPSPSPTAARAALA